MSQPGAFDEETRQPGFCSIGATSGAIAGLFHGDPAKALVMTCIGQLVARGYAQWDMLDNGDIRLRFHMGETFLLGEKMIIRLT